jgi:hypothetical protein
VFDLTVSGHRCYLANGLLVSNSDSFQVLAVGMRKALGSDDKMDLSMPTFDDDDRPVVEAWQGDGEVF